MDSRQLAFPSVAQEEQKVEGKDLGRICIEMAIELKFRKKNKFSTC